MFLTRYAIANDRVTAMMVVLAVVAGITSFCVMPRAEDPGFTVHTALVSTYLPGAAPERIEQLVTDRLEKAVQELPELEKIRSESRTGVSLVWVDIQERYHDLRPIWDKLRRRMDDVRPRLPAGTAGPFVNDEFGDVFGIIVTVSGRDFSYRELKDVADRLRERLLDLEDAAKVVLYGVQDERIFVEFKNARLTELGLSPQLLIDILRKRNIIMPGGRVETGREEIVLEPTGKFESLDDLKKTVISLPGREGMFYLGDVVDVRRGYVDPPSSLMRSGGKPCIGIGVSLRDGGNVLRLGRGVKQALRRVEEDTPWGVDFETVAFQPEVVSGKVDEFVDNLLQAIGLVLVVMVLTMGLKMGLMVAGMIPVTVLASIFLMWAAGIGLDQVSLSSLIIALGMLVDNGIVMVEAMAVTMADGTSGEDAALSTSSELAWPLLSSSLTTVAAFLPVYLAKSTTGEYTNALFKVLGITLMCSWVVSLTMTPLLCVHLLKKRKPGRPGREPSRRRRLYGRILDLALSRRKTALLLASAAFALAMWAMRFVPFIFFPPRDTRLFTVELDLPPGTSIRYTAGVVSKIDEFIASELATRGGPVTTWAAFIGRSAPRFVLTYAPTLASPEHATIIVNTRRLEDIPAAMARLEDYCFENFPDLEMTAKRPVTGPAVPSPIEMKFSGNSVPRLMETCRRFEAFLRRHGGARNVRNDWGIRSKKLLVEVDQPRARRAGVSSLGIAVALQSGLGGIETTQFHEKDESIPVILRSEASLRKDIDKLDTINVFPAKGRPVPLKQVADIELTWQSAKIKRLNRKRTIAARADLVPGWTAAEVSADFIDWLDREERRRWLPDEKFTLCGEMAESSKANRSILEQLPLAAAAIVLLLVVQFNSLRRSLIVLVTIPMGLIGVIVGLLVMKSYFGFMTLLGVVSLSGIVVNNAIVLLERIEIERSAGSGDPLESVKTAAYRRLRPILLTTATTIGGLLPLYFGGGAMWRPMAVAIMFGLAFSTVLTLGLVPVLYCTLFGVGGGRDAGSGEGGDKGDD